MSLSFEALAREIKEAVAQQSLQSGQAPLSDEEWRAFFDWLLPEGPTYAMSARVSLGKESGESALRLAYRLVLGRDIDPEGLTSGLRDLATGIPILLIAARLQRSDEAAQGQVQGTLQLDASLRYFNWLASIERLAQRLRLSGLLLSLARASQKFALIWDAPEHLRFESLRNHGAVLRLQTLSRRLVGQLAAAQARQLDLEHQISLQAANFKVALARLNASAAAAQAAGRSAALAAQPAESAAQTSVSAELEAYYLAFENAHRGSPAQLAEQYVAYLPLVETIQSLAQAHPQARALDLGCGRGEWLHFLGQHGVPAWGVDQNAVMLSEAKARGCEVSAMDLITALKAQPDQSLLLVSAFHVAEHLPFEVLYALVGQAHRVLLPGGRLLLETPNPENLLVGAHTFYHDHTHRNPLTPTALSFLLRYWGFEQVDVLRLHPYPESARVPGHDPLTERVNGHLCGPQDFAVLGTR